MIVDNILFFAIFVSLAMVVGLALTVTEFRYGSPKQQQREAEVNPQAVAAESAKRPAR